jgi:hypothetical protein
MVHGKAPLKPKNGLNGPPARRIREKVVAENSATAGENEPPLRGIAIGAILAVVSRHRPPVHRELWQPCVRGPDGRE